MSSTLDGMKPSTENRASLKKEPLTKESLMAATPTEWITPSGIHTAHPHANLHTEIDGEKYVLNSINTIKDPKAAGVLRVTAKSAKDVAQDGRLARVAQSFDVK